MTQPTLVKYYRPTESARIRNPVTNTVVPPYGQVVRSHFFIWAKRVRTGEAEEIESEKDFFAGRDKALKADAEAAKKASGEGEALPGIDKTEAAKANKGGDKSAADKSKKGSK